MYILLSWLKSFLVGRSIVMIFPLFIFNPYLAAYSTQRQIIARFSPHVQSMKYTSNMLRNGLTKKSDRLHLFAFLTAF